MTGSTPSDGMPSDAMKKKILVVDDEPQILLMVSARLKANHYDVVTAFSGEQGLERAKKEMPDLVLLDLVMPEMDGEEALERLKQDPATKRIPVIIFTADTRRGKIREHQMRGAVDCLFKPFVSEELLSKVQKVLGKKK